MGFVDILRGLRRSKYPFLFAYSCRRQKLRLKQRAIKSIIFNYIVVAADVTPVFHPAASREPTSWLRAAVKIRNSSANLPQTPPVARRRVRNAGNSA